MIRVILPHHLQKLAQTNKEVLLQVEGPTTVEAILNTLEAQYPMLGGTIRDYATRQRRPYLRFFACGEDLSFEPPEFLLPEEVEKGVEPFRIVGAMAGG
jgi:molybdopterin synthase sulfur carrier subunit